MKKGIVKFSKEFVTSIGLKEWVGVELEYEMSDECPKDVLTNAKKIVEQWHMQVNTGTMYGPVGITPYDGNSFPGPRIIEKTPEDREPGLTPELLMECKDIKALDIFYKLIIRLNREDLMEAYNKRKEELLGKETKEILDATEKHTKSKTSV